MLELQYELESKAARWYAALGFVNAFFSIPLATECRPRFALMWRGVQYTWNRLPRGWKRSPTTSHGLIQSVLERGDAPEHLQYVCGIIVWGSEAEEVFEKGKKNSSECSESWVCHKEKQGQGTCTGHPILGRQKAGWPPSCAYGCG